jgi:hypothetical protein
LILVLDLDLVIVLDLDLDLDLDMDCRNPGDADDYARFLWYSEGALKSQMTEEKRA